MLTFGVQMKVWLSVVERCCFGEEIFNKKPLGRNRFICCSEGIVVGRCHLWKVAVPSSCRQIQSFTTTKRCLMIYAYNFDDHSHNLPNPFYSSHLQSRKPFPFDLTAVLPNSCLLCIFCSN